MDAVDEVPVTHSQSEMALRGTTSLYRMLAVPSRIGCLDPPDTMITRTFETVDNDCTVGLLVAAILPIQ
jgi:hypothetical protein